MLTLAFTQIYKDMRVDMKGEQPFPDSWIATTAPVALGFLTDISSEIVLAHGAAGRELIWPSIGSMIQRWCNGDTKEIGWSPCEAVVRIACREMSRFTVRLADALTRLSPEEAIVWTKYFFKFSTGILSQSLDLENAVQDKLLGAKLKGFKRTSSATNGHQNGSSNAAPDSKAPLQTPFGLGTILKERVDHHGPLDIAMYAIRLDYGMLYGPVDVLAKDQITVAPSNSVEGKGKHRLSNWTAQQFHISHVIVFICFQENQKRNSKLWIE
jgi:hypothetical protein